MALLGNPLFTALDSAGALISGAQAFFYLAGTTTPATVYHDAGLTTPHEQPLLADGAGRFADVYFDPAIDYKLVLKSAAGVMIRTTDPVYKAPDLSGLFTLTRADAPLAKPWVLKDWAGKEVRVMDWVPADIRADIKAQANSADLSEYVQAAFDEAPLGCDLVFDGRDWRIGGSLTLSRQMNLIGRGARLIGVFGADQTSNLLNIEIEESTFGNGDVRRMKIEGLDAYFASGGFRTIHVENKAPMAANLMMLIERCGIEGPNTGEGSAALAFKGLVTQAHVVRNCQIDNTIHLDKCADGVQIEQCTIGGDRAGVLCDLAQGAFRTGIRRNIIVSRDCGIIVENGAEIDIIENQIEQHGLNAHPDSAQLLIYPQTYGAQRIRVIGNNFGGGPNVDVPIRCRGGAGGMDDLFVDQNTFATGASGKDVILHDDGVRWARFGPNNTFRYNRNGLIVNTATGAVTYAADGADASGNAVDPTLQITDLGLGTIGVPQPGSALNLTAGWTASSAFSFKKELNGDVTFTGNLEPGTLTPFTAIGTLPPGFRPPQTIIIAGTSDAGSNPLQFIVAAEGQITLLSVTGTPTSTTLSSFKAAMRTTYDPGV